MGLVEKLSEISEGLKAQAQSSAALSEIIQNAGFEVQKYGDEKFAEGKASVVPGEPAQPGAAIYTQEQMDAAVQAKESEMKQAMIEKDQKILELQNEVDSKIAAAVKAARDEEVAAFVQKYKDVSVDNAAMIAEMEARIAPVAQ